MLKKIAKIISGVRANFTLDILPLLAVVFVIKFIISFAPSFDVDMNTWISWAHRMTSLGPGSFYSPEVWTQYTPGFLYYLWLIGKLGVVNEIIIKLPTIIADIALGAVLYRLVLTQSKARATMAFLFYTLSPVVLFDGSVWGQIDGIMALFMFLGTWAILEKKHPAVIGACFALAFLLKPQAAAIVPAIAIIAIGRRAGGVMFRAIFYTTIAVLASSIPFFPQDPLFGIFGLVSEMTGYYAYTSVFAFNLWALVGMWQSDSGTFLSISYFSWGIVIYAIAVLSTSLAFARAKLDPKAKAYLLVAAVLFAAFLFPTRVHERYIFPMFPFLLAAAFLMRSKFLMLIYWSATILVFLNLYHPYAYYTQNWLSSSAVLAFTESTTKPISAMLILSFVGTLFWKKGDKMLSKLKTLKPTFTLGNYKTKDKLSEKATKLIILGVVLFSIAVRLTRLDYPSTDYFDEIYHAFTARQILAGDPLPWHWTSPHPEGFAYEWTHPPLAKEIMAASMAIFGVNSFTWRLPGALLGAVVVYLTYLIAKKLFSSRDIGVLAAVIIALDGLVLAMSRIGTADIYFMAFGMGAFYLFLDKKYFVSAALLGLALASKWSTIWLLPVFAFSFLVLRRKIEPGLLWFVVLVPALYLASYAPMFVYGHDLSTFWGMQKQMWWYHTNLTATHPYMSAWWSWPIMLRPVYLFQNYAGNMVSNIYASGNPFFFWLGLPAVVWSARLAFTRKIASLAIVVFGYFALFAPWVSSPRIMFIYHYLPSLPFLAISLSFILTKYRALILPFVLVLFVAFVYFFPHWTAMPVPTWWDKTYYWLSSWR